MEQDLGTLLPWAAALLPAMWLLIGSFIAQIRATSRCRPHRDAWELNYGHYADAIDTVWLGRTWSMDERQAKLDASQNVMTRLV